MKSQVTTLLLAVVLTLGLAGCDTIQEIDRAAGEYAKELKARRAAEQQREAQAGAIPAVQRGQCRQASGTILFKGIGPDVAYVRLKRYFGYDNWKEKEQQLGEFVDILKSSQYRHDTLPGVSYAMHQDVYWPSSAYGRVYVWLNLDIEKDPAGTRILWNHCKGTDGWEKLDSRADQNLRRDLIRVVTGR